MAMNFRALIAMLALAVAFAIAWSWFAPVRPPAPDLARTEPLRARLARGERMTWVALGDSITAGVNAPRSWVALFEAKIRSAYPQALLELINAGVPGDTAAEGLARLGRDVLPRKPAAVFIEFGWNDLKNGVSVESFETTLREMVARLRSPDGPMVFLMTTTQVDVPLANRKVRAHNRAIRRVAEENDLGLIDLHLHFQAAGGRDGTSLKDLLSSDHIHPSEMGQTLIAEAVAREFEI